MRGKEVLIRALRVVPTIHTLLSLKTRHSPERFSAEIRHIRNFRLGYRVQMAQIPYLRPRFDCESQRAIKM